MTGISVQARMGMACLCCEHASPMCGATLALSDAHQRHTDLLNFIEALLLSPLQGDTSQHKVTELRLNLQSQVGGGFSSATDALQMLGIMMHDLAQFKRTLLNQNCNASSTWAKQAFIFTPPARQCQQGKIKSKCSQTRQMASSPIH